MATTQRAHYNRGSLDTADIRVGDYVTLNDSYSEAWRGGHVVGVRTFISQYAATAGQSVTMLTLGFGHRGDSKWFWRYGHGGETPAAHVVRVQRCTDCRWTTVR